MFPFTAWRVRPSTDTSIRVTYEEKIEHWDGLP